MSEIKGDCYEAAAKIILWDFDKFAATRGRELTLVHGECYGTGGNAFGIWFGHAWLEYTAEYGQVFCVNVANGDSRIIEKEMFYAAGSIRRTKRYTQQQTKAKILEHDHWGHWDLTTEH